MHPQIQQVCANLTVQGARSKSAIVCMSLSSGEQTPLGKILFHMYYRTGLTGLLDRDDYCGYPHNGGSHTFSFRGPKGDALSFLELLSEEVLYVFKDPEIRKVGSELMFISQEILSRK